MQTDIMDNIKIDLGEIECKNMERVHLAQNGIQRQDIVNTLNESWVP
jgi:hypothetical protein